MEYNDYSSTGIILLIIILAVIWLLCALIPCFMAKARGRSVIGWLLLSWCIGFWWTVIILLCIGDSKEKAFKDLGLGDYNTVKYKNKLQ